MPQLRVGEESVVLSATLHVSVATGRAHLAGDGRCVEFDADPGGCTVVSTLPFLGDAGSTTVRLGVGPCSPSLAAAAAGSCGLSNGSASRRKRERRRVRPVPIDVLVAFSSARALAQRQGRRRATSGGLRRLLLLVAGVVIR